MDDPTAQLQRLVTSGFVGAPVPNDQGDGYIALVYMRWWSSGVLDVVTVYGERDASAYRAGGLDPSYLENIGAAVVRWRTAGSVVDVTTELLELPAPSAGSVLISERPADQHLMSHSAGKLWAP
ncbi:hypothetical protein [Parasphingorhabdus pacifica]